MRAKREDCAPRCLNNAHSKRICKQASPGSPFLDPPPPISASVCVCVAEYEAKFHKISHRVIKPDGHFVQHIFGPKTTGSQSFLNWAATGSMKSGPSRLLRRLRPHLRPGYPPAREILAEREGREGKEEAGVAIRERKEFLRKQRGGKRGGGSVAD